MQTEVDSTQKQVQSLLYIACWTLAMYLAWSSGDWSDQEEGSDQNAHDAQFHMHQPLHDGGKVSMDGQFHFELASQTDGTHRPLFTDYDFHNFGVGWQGSEQGDLGRFEVSGDPENRGAFKTPMLRDVSRTAPYMHDGSLATLREVIELYNLGGVQNPNLDRLMKPLDLSDVMIDDLLEFLRTLDGRFDASTDKQAPESSNLDEGDSP